MGKAGPHQDRMVRQALQRVTAVTAAMMLPLRLYQTGSAQAPCMLLGLVTEKYDAISVQDIGLTGKTEADGLACPTCSGLSAGIMASLLAGEATADDHRLYYYMKELFEAEGIFIEPSSCAAFQALMAFHDHAIPDKEATAAAAPENVTHIIWATGGSFMPQEERDRLLK